MLHAAELRERLRSRLEADPEPRPGPEDRLAAVLVPLVAGPEPSLLLTVRSAGLSRHAGEISFPGGLLDEGESPVAAALREADEEIGLARGLPEVLGALPPVHTHVSGILVVPFVGWLDSEPALRASEHEIEEILRFPLARLAEAEAPMTLERSDGGQWHGYRYVLDGHTIWGATGWMLHALLASSVEEPI
jgi:8-oxo-dGTP pyrophosphatase MutT (NUDIX family)